MIGIGSILELVGLVLVLVAAFATSVLLGLAVLGVLLVALGYLWPEPSPVDRPTAEEAIGR